MSPKRRKRKDRLIELLELQNVMAEALSNNELQTMQRRWRRSFAKRVILLTGKEIYKGFDWHAFSYCLVHSIDGDDARHEYNKESCTQFYILPHMNEWKGYKCQSNQLPQFDRKGIDVYICPFDYKWSMIYTHEGDRCGPYFTRAEWADMKTEPIIK